MNQFWTGDECERAQTLTTTTTGSKNHKKESTVRLTTRITMLWPHKGLSFTGVIKQSTNFELNEPGLVWG